MTWYGRTRRDKARNAQAASPRYELWLSDQVHRPLDATTPAQAVARGTAFARRYRTPNVRQVRIMQVQGDQAPIALATVEPWSLAP